MKIDINKMAIQSIILTALREAYFRRTKREKIGGSPGLTAEIDLLEIAIKELTESIKNEK